MSRSKWKAPMLNKTICRTLQSSKKNYKQILITKNSEILPKFFSKTFKIYNGKQFYEILVTENIIGYKFGEFLSTRKRFSFKKKNR